MLSVLWRIAFSKYLNDDFSVKRLVYTLQQRSNAGENLLTSLTPTRLLSWLLSFRSFADSFLFLFFLILFITRYASDKPIPRRKYRLAKGKIYGTITDAWNARSFSKLGSYWCENSRNKRRSKIDLESLVLRLVLLFHHRDQWKIEEEEEEEEK